MSEGNTSEQSDYTKFRSLFICLFLTASILSVYLQVINFDFVSFDDGEYISKNLVKGLTLENITWALTAEVCANWHPLTVLSHMMDCQLFGLDASWHHLMNLFFHIANTLLLFFVLKRMTGAIWQCAFVAALFALHPLHVESVAWIAERKDVLSTFFWMLTMWAYVRYVEHPGGKTYIPIIAFFVLGLMAKPMLVTLPFVLILLDYWPLKRLRFEAVSGRGIISHGTSFSHIMYEKIPLFVFSAASCVVTYHYQKLGGALPFVRLSLYEKASNAFISYIDYIIKTIWPFNLAVFYPYSSKLLLGEVAGAFILCVFLTYLAFKSLKRNTFFSVGWLWYLGTLVPVIGLVQVGSQAMADRYTYIPLIGIFIIIAWGVPETLSNLRHKTKYLTVLSLAIILILIPITWRQVRYWTNNVSLFEHALHVTEGNYLALNNLALSLAKKGETEKAATYFKDAIKINPSFKWTYNNLADLLATQGKTDAALRYYSLSLRIDPAQEETHVRMGHLLAKQDRTDEAINHFSKALIINPGNVMAHHNLGKLLATQDKTDAAIRHFSDALRINPVLRQTHIALGTALAIQGKHEKAIEHLHAGLNDMAKAHFMMGRILLSKGQIDEAVINLIKSLQINNNDAMAHTVLGYALITQGWEDKAIEHCMEAIRIDPEKSINAYYNLACIYARKNRINESIDWLKKAVDKGFNDWKTLRTDKDLENIRDSEYYNEVINNNTTATKASGNEE